MGGRKGMILEENEECAPAVDVSEGPRDLYGGPFS